MCRVERKAGEGSKRRDVLLVRVSNTFRICAIFVDEFADPRFFSLAAEKQHNHA